MHKIVVIRLYFPLDVLHISDYICPFQEQIYKLYITFGICQIGCTAYKVARDDGLIQSETCTASNRK